MLTSNLKKIVDRRKKRLGRGAGSGKGFHTSSRGQKGQTSRGGYHEKRAHQGDKTSLIQRLPVYRGFKALDASEKPVAVKISQLTSQKIFKIDNAALSQVVKSGSVKLVGQTDYEGIDLSKLEVSAEVNISKSLKQKILDAGGKVE